MRELGHDWSPMIVSNIERGVRDVSGSELFSLGLLFGATPHDLLDADADVQVGNVVIQRNLLQAWLEGFGKLWLSDDGKLTFDSDLALEFMKREGLLVPEETTASTNSPSGDLSVERENEDG